MNEIIIEQLNADVIGCVLENTSIFSGRLVLGGSVILMRRGKIKTATIEIEEVEIDDPYDTFGNNNDKGDFNSHNGAGGATSHNDGTRLLSSNISFASINI